MDVRYPSPLVGFNENWLMDEGFLVSTTVCYDTEALQQGMYAVACKFSYKYISVKRRRAIDNTERQVNALAAQDDRRSGEISPNISQYKKHGWWK